jgi:predicted NAD/FAD-dependent oxidoreductase
MAVPPASSPIPPVGIIGAGVSGLLASRLLTEARIPHWIIDKGRRVGGRLATRESQDARFDHGAQYFTARDPRFRALIKTAMADGVVRTWATGFRLGDGTLKNSGEPRYICPEGINAFARWLAKPVSPEVSTHAVAIRHDGSSWVVKIKDGPARRARALVVTCPAPQSMELLAAGDVKVSPESLSSLAAIQYDPCFALLVVCQGPSQIPPPGGMWPTDGPFGWIADNRQKGITNRITTLTFHTRPDFTRAHLNDDRDVLATHLLQAAAPFLAGTVLSHQLHRWLYSIPIECHPKPFLAIEEPGILLFGGDGFGGPRVEGAALSGIEMGTYLVERGKNSS